jgi:molybdenum-dependent DNA-binding transcriptional regulator ModE
MGDSHKRDAPERRPNRVIKLEHPGGGRRRVYVPLKRRSARFLAALEESGNVSLACEAAGLGKDRTYKLRRDDAAFAAAWDAAKAAFARRAEAGDGIDLDAIARDGLAVRRGRGGQVQIVSAHPAAWTRRDEEAFFAHYAASGNVSAAARAAGFSAKAAWERANAVPAFRERLAEAKRHATERLDFYLVEEGTNLLKSARPDPQLAMWLLKREDARAAGTLNRGAAARGRGKGPPERSYEEARDSVLRKVEAIEQHRDRQRLAEGWVKTEEGHWIPPGYGKIQ